MRIFSRQRRDKAQNVRHDDENAQQNTGKAAYKQNGREDDDGRIPGAVRSIDLKYLTEDSGGLLVTRVRVQLTNGRVAIFCKVEVAVVGDLTGPLTRDLERVEHH